MIMTHQLDQLKKQLNDWMRRKELDTDLDFWTQEEW